MFALVDSRLEPLESDLAFIEWLSACKLPASVVFTKVDKCSEGLVENHVSQFLEKLNEYKVKVTKLFRCSAKNRSGRSEILQFVETLLPKKTNVRNRVSLTWMKK